LKAFYLEDPHLRNYPVFARGSSHVKRFWVGFEDPLEALGLARDYLGDCLWLFRVQVRKSREYLATSNLCFEG